MERNTNIEQSALIDTLHDAIKSLFFKKILRNISSCLKETLDNAFGRFSELGVCNS